MPHRIDFRNSREGKDLIAVGVVIVVIGIGLAILGVAQSALDSFDDVSTLVCISFAVVPFGLLLWGIGRWRHWRAN